MARIAFFADIHANREAMDACFVHAGRWRAERYVFLGDLVGYGADPGPVVDEVMRRVADGGVAVLGNHDQAVAAGPRATMSPDARQVIEWTREHLAPHQLEFLGSLPMQVEEGERLYVHANAYAPAGWDYVTSSFDAGRSMAATRSRLTFCGHVHTPALYHVGATGRVGAFQPVPGISIPLSAQRHWLALPGSVGQPRDGLPAACYALLDSDVGMLTYFRVAFDVEAAAAKVRAAGLPQRLGDRLEQGL